MNPKRLSPHISFFPQNNLKNFSVGTLKWGVIWPKNRPNVKQKVSQKQLFLWKMRYLSNTIHFYYVKLSQKQFCEKISWSRKVKCPFFINFGGFFRKTLKISQITPINPLEEVKYRQPSALKDSKVYIYWIYKV